MATGSSLVEFSVKRPRWVAGGMVAVTLAAALLAGLPSIWPRAFSPLHRVRVDTDPENMLRASEPVRVFHDEMKRRLSLHDMVVVGVVNDSHPDGVFNPDSLAKVHQLAEFAKTLTWPDENDPGRTVGVIEVDLIAPSTVDSIEPGGPGVVKFEWLMRTPPATPEAAREIRRKAQRVPFLNGTVVSDKPGKEGKAVCLYLPLTHKDLSYRVYSALRRQIPVLWLWGPLALEYHRLPGVREREREAILRLGRLAGFYANSRREFNELVESLEAHLTADPQRTWMEIEQILDAWTRRAEARDKAEAYALERIPQGGHEQGAADRYRAETRQDANQALRDYIRKHLDPTRKRTWATWMLPFIELFVESKRNSGLSAGDLLAATKDFARSMGSSLAGAAKTEGVGDLLSRGDKGRERHSAFPGADEYHITGLPVAEDTFGVEMFIQMAISAPLAMAVIFLLMLAFFHKLVLVVSPMIVAIVSVIVTMAALVIAGKPIHIMSSMIPIFIMPIAVLDSIHIISEFFERYQQTRDRRRTMRAVMDALFMPMLYTSLTSAAGFASLALTPIPPVQVFGLFVAMGIMVAWLLTVTFIPAYVMFIKPETLANFGAAHRAGEAARDTPLGRFLHGLGRATYRRAKLILALGGAVIVLAAVGISRIRINDNPIKWFTKSHPIRRADRVLNEHFGGTYMAYLALTAEPPRYDAETMSADFAEQLQRRGQDFKDQFPQAAPVILAELPKLARDAAAKAASGSEFFTSLNEQVGQLSKRSTGELAFAWEEAATFVAQQRQRAEEVFKDPAVLRYMADLEAELGRTGVVGKSNSLATIVKSVHRDLLSGESQDLRIPDSARMVAECLMQFQNSHRPRDLWHFVTPDYRTSSIWVQLNSGDNRDMERVTRAAAGYMKTHPPPPSLRAAPAWFGLTYINVIWQDKMVTGMLGAFGGSFLVVFLLMTILFRSALWGLLSMIPLTVTIGLIYGVIGFIGKDYDMPVAVLSSLTLGLAVDFSIHFLARSRSLHAASGSWEVAAPAVFGEPARAIARNIVVIAAGFLPLLFAPLVPYRTVGIFLAAILLVSGVGTLLLLPALVRVLQRRLFAVRAVMGAGCNCVFCGVASATLVVLIALNLRQLAGVGWTTLTWVSLAAVPALAISCGVLSRRQKCKEQPASEEASGDEKTS